MSQPLRETEPGLVWRSDLDPVALPATEHLTAAQRKVLQACLATFADRGFAGSSIRDIAAVAGVQSASLYKHFPSKEAMLVALARLGHEICLKSLLAAVLDAGSDPRDQLAAVTRAHVLAHCEYPRLGVITNSDLVHLSAEELAPISVLREQMQAISIEIMRRGREQGVFDVVNPVGTLAALGSMGVAVAAWFPYSKDFTADELADHYALLALRMVGTTPKET